MRKVGSRCGRSSLGLTLAAAMLGLASPLQANSPNIGRDGGAIFPLESNSIQLVRESVLVRLTEDFTVPVRCDYTLRNLKNETQTIEMSFLVPPAASPGLPYDADDTYTSTNFVVAVGMEHPVVEWLTPKPGAWAAYSMHTPEVLPAWTVSFKPHEEVHVEIMFDSAWSSSTYKGRFRSSYTYLAKVASLWAGRVDDAAIFFDLGGVLSAALQAAGPSSNGFKYEIAPRDFEWRDTGVVWRRVDWEPAEDFEISFEYTLKDKE